MTSIEFTPASRALGVMFILFMLLPGVAVVEASEENADIQCVEGLVALGRERGQGFALVRTNVAGRDLVVFVDQSKATAAEAIDLPDGYYPE